MPAAIERLPAHFVELVCDAVLKVYWFKNSFRHFLRRCGVAETLISTLAADETKRDFLDRLVPKLETSQAGILTINRIADAVLEQRTFPDLERLEDSKLRIKHAHEAISALREYRQRQHEQAQDARDRDRTRRSTKELRDAAIARQHRLEVLNDRLTKLAAKMGAQGAGYEFETWFFDLVDYFEVPNRRPYTTNGRQIDGSVTVDGTTYLIELKFTASQSAAPDIDIFRSKVLSKADNTMGIMVSISGYSGVAIAEASREKTPLLLLDHSHIYMLLTGTALFNELVSRVRRHSSQTGESYLRPGDFGQ
jgi:hypothetical protein